MGEEKRHQMMQNLFGDQSEEEEEIDSEHESNPQPNYASVDIGDQRDESDAKDSDSDAKEEYGHRVATSRRRDVIESGSEEHHYVDHEDEEVDQARSPSKSPEEEKDQAQNAQSAPAIRDVFGDSEDEEEDAYAVRNDIEQDSNRSPMEEEESYEKNLRPEDMLADEDAQYESEEENREAKPKEKPLGPPLEIEMPFCQPPADPKKSWGVSFLLEDTAGTVLDVLFIPALLVFGGVISMNMIKVSNIMGIDPNQFDPKTYVEEKTFVTDESGAQKRIRLENNIVRWRTVKNPDGSNSVESNARFVRWSDGSLQLLIGNEVLDISVQDAQQDQTHLFLRHNKVTSQVCVYVIGNDDILLALSFSLSFTCLEFGLITFYGKVMLLDIWIVEHAVNPPIVLSLMSLLQSQGRILRKMRFMPSSLSSNSHRLLTALVDSRHRKAYKVKNCITDIDPEREKEEKEKAESQTIRANVLLNRKREKVSRKYTPTVERRRQLSPGFLEGALDEDDEPDYYNSRRSRRFEEDLEVEARAEKRIMNAKKGQRDIPRKSSMSAVKSSKRPVDFSDSEREESEYETDGDEYERSPVHKRVDEPEHEYEEEEEEHYEEDIEVNGASEEEEEPKQKGKEFGSGRKRIGFESEEDSPPRKIQSGRRMTVVYDSDEE
ncbi:hypothetical protein POTOM_041964 [Populus tomentosa]|uniref:RNA polymerase-associated protein LEO1 n=1 Tax=Populus tomentosa TaxID=118781 RepID=A0A8X7YMZ1_POPTO|nr:hypothetical protein POTOM_041964 [Populus tomentosa]